MSVSVPDCWSAGGRGVRADLAGGGVGIDTLTAGGRRDGETRLAGDGGGVVDFRSVT